MKTWVRKTLSVGVLAAGALLFTSGVAHADDVDQRTWDNNGIGNGIQAAVPVNLGANVIGNAIGVAGEGNAAGSGGNWFESARSHKQTSTDNNGVLNGAQVLVPVQTGINVTGNAISALGEANAAGQSGNSFGGGKHHRESAQLESKDRDRDRDRRGGNGPTQASWDNNGILNGLQVYIPIDLGANVCGNAVGILGEANAQSVCGNSFGGDRRRESGRSDDIRQISTDNNGIANGAQIAAPINTLINLSGNAISVAGESNAAAASRNTEKGGDDIQQVSTDNNGILNGAQVAVPVDLGLNLCGNSLGVLGEANAAANCGNDFGGDRDRDRDRGNGGNNGGHHGGHHGGNNNGGDNGHDDDDRDYAGDNGNDDDDNGGNNGGADDDDKPYGGGDSARPMQKSAKSATEASPVAGLTDGLTKNNSVGGLGGLEILNALR